MAERINDEEFMLMSGVVISADDAYDLLHVLDFEYHKGIVIDELKERGIDVEAVPDEILNEVTVQYESDLNDSEPLKKIVQDTVFSKEDTILRAIEESQKAPAETMKRERRGDSDERSR